MGMFRLILYIINIDPKGLVQLQGSWLKEPLVNIQGISFTNSHFISPYMTWWGYVKLYRINGYAYAFINIDVKCSSECDDFEVHEKIPLVHYGHIDIGPNVIATGLGLLTKSPWVSIGANIVTTGGSLLAFEYQMLKEIQQKTHLNLQEIKSNGPTAICKARKQTL